MAQMDKPSKIFDYLYLVSDCPASKTVMCFILWPWGEAFLELQSRNWRKSHSSGCCHVNITSPLLEVCVDCDREDDSLGPFLFVVCGHDSTSLSFFFSGFRALSGTQLTSKNCRKTSQCFHLQHFLQLWVLLSVSISHCLMTWVTHYRVLCFADSPLWLLVCVFMLFSVGYILNVTREIDNFFPESFTYMNIRVYDVETTDLLSHWTDTYNFINTARYSLRGNSGIFRPGSCFSIFYCLNV